MELQLFWVEFTLDPINPDILAEKNGFIWIQFGCTSFYSGIHSCSDQNPYFPTTVPSFGAALTRIREMPSYKMCCLLIQPSTQGFGVPRSPHYMDGDWPRSMRWCPATWPNLHQNHHFSPNEIDANCVKIPMKIPMKIPLSTLKFTKAGPQNWSSPATCCHQPSSVSTRCTSTVRDLGRWTRWSPLEIRENDGFHQQKSEGIHDDFTGKIMCFEHI